MQYKFEFMLDDFVPPEYKVYHLENKKREAAEKITEMLLKDCPFIDLEYEDKRIWSMEVVAYPKKRYQQFIDALNSGLIDRNTRAFVLALLERMEEPWEEYE